MKVMHNEEGIDNAEKTLMNRVMNITNKNIEKNRGNNMPNEKTDVLVFW